MTPRTSIRGRKVMHPCYVCGRKFLQNLYRRLRPCGSDECLKLQSARKAELVAAIGPAEKPRSEPSEQSQRGGYVLVPVSIDTASGLAETTTDEDIPDDSDTVIDPEDKTREANKKRIKLKNEQKTERIQRSASLEQPVVAVPIGPVAAPYGRDENGNPIRPPTMGHTMARQIDVVPAPEQKPISLYSPKPEVPRPDPAESIWHNSRESGDSADSAAGRWKRKAFELRPGEVPISVSASSGQDLVRQIESHAMKPFGLDIPRRGSKQTHAPRVTRPLRQIFDISRAQIVAWLADLNILFIEEPVRERVCRTEKVTLPVDNTEFEKQRADKIAVLQKQLVEHKSNLADLRQRWRLNGKTNRENTVLKKGLLKYIAEVRREITTTSRAKPPETPPQQIEVDIPGTEYERLTFKSTRTLHMDWVKGYLESYDAYGFPLNPQVNDATFREFEDAVIYQALSKKVFVVDADVLALYSRKYPGFLDPGQEKALGDRQEDCYAEYDSHASGLRFRGRGIKVTGNKYYGKALETFDGVFRTHRGLGGSSGEMHSGAPDFDPSDDTND